jgi:hypothetical protein
MQVSGEVSVLNVHAVDRELKKESSSFGIQKFVT